MGKTRVHELAAEFGISAEQLMGLLKEMNIFVRTHMSALEPDQVAQEKLQTGHPDPADREDRRRRQQQAERGDQRERQGPDAGDHVEGRRARDQPRAGRRGAMRQGSRRHGGWR